MEGVEQQDLIVKTIASLISIAAELRCKEMILGEPEEHHSDVIADDSDSVTSQMGTQIANLNTALAAEIQKRATLVGQITEFREKLKQRHTKVADNVLAKYSEFFGLQDA